MFRKGREFIGFPFKIGACGGLLYLILLLESFSKKNGACGGLKKYNVQYNIQIWKMKSKYKYNIVSIVDMIRFHYQFRKKFFLAFSTTF